MLKQLRLIIKTMRPKQWIKNIFVLAAVVFDRQLTNTESLMITLLAMLLFCLVSSLVYIINDLADVEADRQHPQKQHRPLASGELSRNWAIGAAVFLGLVAFPAAFWLNFHFGLLISGYFLLMLAYSFWLKHVPLLDVMIIAVGFVLRVAGGQVIIVTERFSPWLYVATTFLALFIGIGKRRAELELLEAHAVDHRPVLDGYNLDFLDQLLIIVLSSTMMTYCLYTFTSADNLGNYAMLLTIPFVIYALFRYLYLLRVKHVGGAPEVVVLTDRPMLFSIILWGLAVLLILYLS